MFHAISSVVAPSPGLGPSLRVALAEPGRRVSNAVILAVCLAIVLDLVDRTAWKFRLRDMVLARGGLVAVDPKLAHTVISTDRITHAAGHGVVFVDDDLDYEWGEVLLGVGRVIMTCRRLNA